MAQCRPILFDSTGAEVFVTYSVQVMDCKYGCGKRYAVTSRMQKPPHCVQCAIQAASDNMVQLARKSGPYYDRWLDAMAKSRSRWVMGVKLFAERLS